MMVWQVLLHHLSDRAAIDATLIDQNYRARERADVSSVGRGWDELFKSLFKFWW